MTKESVTCSACKGEHETKDCNWGDMSPADKFDALLNQWHKNEETIVEIQKKQDPLRKLINETFGVLVKEQNLLALLPWRVRVPGRVLLECHVKETAVQEFLAKIEWDDKRHHWSHYALQLGDTHIYVDDGIMSLSFDDSDELIVFCKKHGIKPSLSALKERQQKASNKVRSLDKMMDKLR